MVRRLDCVTHVNSFTIASMSDCWQFKNRLGDASDAAKVSISTAVTRVWLRETKKQRNKETKRVTYYIRRRLYLCVCVCVLFTYQFSRGDKDDGWLRGCIWTFGVCYNRVVCWFTHSENTRWESSDIVTLNNTFNGEEGAEEDRNRSSDENL